METIHMQEVNPVLCWRQCVPAGERLFILSISSQTLYSVMLTWELEIGKGRSIYTMEIVKCYKSLLPFLPSPESVVIKHLPAQQSETDPTHFRNQIEQRPKPITPLLSLQQVLSYFLLNRDPLDLELSTEKEIFISFNKHSLNTCTL